jgi:dihydrodipicolinate synthase/N-acetylneuraminate lyase
MAADHRTGRWSGVFSALTTKFSADGSLDLRAIETHIAWQLRSGVDGLVVLGSLGENGALEPDEKQEIIRLAASVARDRVPLLAGVAETTTTRACRFVEQASRNGANGFMLLPPMQYVADPRETLTFWRTVASVAEHPIMLYNNPVAYRVDVTPEMFAEVAGEPKFVAIKESSDNIRRVTDIRNLVGDRFQLFAGVDDLSLESFVIGADGWVAGLVCAFPVETVTLFHLARAGRIAEALTLYRWFTPLLHLDVSVKFIQNIKLAETIVGVGTEYVRPPRLPLIGEERQQVETIVRNALATRPVLPDIELLTR